MRIGIGGSSRPLALLILSLLGLLAASGCSKPAPTESSEASSSSEAVMSAARPASAEMPDTSPVLAHIRTGDITTQQVQYYLMSGLCEPLNELPPSAFNRPLPPDRIKKLIDWIAAMKMASAEAKAKSKNDPKLNQFVTTGLQHSLDNVIFGHIYETEFRDNTTTPTQADIQAYYEKRKQLYFQPYSFTIRMIHLQTYEPYIVRAGDTLESIAQQVSDDPGAAENIRADEPGRPPRREPGKMFRPLYPGEKLLVPMNPSRMAQTQARLETILKDLQRTTNTQELDRRFVELARKYDESGLKGDVTSPMPTGTRQEKSPLAAIRKAVNETPVGQMSKIFQTKHGFQVVKVMDRVDSHTLPLSIPEVRHEVISEIVKERTTKANETLMNTLMDNPQLTIDYAQIAQGDRLSTDTVVIMLGEEKLLWQDIKDSWTRHGQPRDEVRIRKSMYTNRALTSLLYREYVRPLTNDLNTELGRQIDAVRTAHVGLLYLTKRASDEVSHTLTRERAKAYYEQHKDKLYKVPPVVTFEAVLWPLNEGDGALQGEARRKAAEVLLQRAQEDLAKIKTPDEFSSLKAMLDEKLTARGLHPEKISNQVPLDTLPPDMQKRFVGVTPGKWTEPAIYGENSVVGAFLVKERIEEHYEPFGQAIDKVNKALFEADFAQVYKRIMDQYAQQAKVELTPQGKSELMIKPGVPIARDSAGGEADSSPRVPNPGAGQDPLPAKM